MVELSCYFLKYERIQDKVTEITVEVKTGFVVIHSITSVHLWILIVELPLCLDDVDFSAAAGGDHGAVSPVRRGGGPMAWYCLLLILKTLANFRQPPMRRRSLYCQS